MLVTKAELNLRGHLTATSPHPFIFNLFNILSASPCMKWALSNKLLGLFGVSLCAPSASALVWLGSLSIVHSVPVSCHSNVQPFSAAWHTNALFISLDNLHLALHDIKLC